jgi:hypothetical protein
MDCVSFASSRLLTSIMKKLWVLILTLLSIVYLINPTAGIFELLPDNIPFVGNVDEGLAAFVLYSCIEYWRGKPIGMFKNWAR